MLLWGGSALGVSRVLHVLRNILHKVNPTPHVAGDNFRPFSFTDGTLASGAVLHYAIPEVIRRVDLFRWGYHANVHNRHELHLF